MREVLVCDANATGAVALALSQALDGSGPAVVVRDFRATRQIDGQPEAFLNVPDEVALLIQTSGSSGTPKTVALSAEALKTSAQAAHERLGGAGQWLLALPLTYIAGISVLTRSLIAGEEAIVMPAGPFDARTFLECVDHMTASRKYSALVPVQLARLVDELERDTSLRLQAQHLDAILIGGQALELELLHRAQAMGLNIVRTYGSSETAGGCVYDGVPLQGVKLRVEENSGEILIAAPQLASGYLGDEQRTNKTFQNKNGKIWYHTGDAGSLTDGVLTVHGRMDRVIISGGLKIDLDAIEPVVKRIPGCYRSAVVHIPDSEWGQRPAVVIQANVDSPDLAATVYDEIVAELGRVAAPKVVRFISEFPLLASGKPDLVALSEFAATQK